MAAEEAHRDAFWVITVVGGLSVAKAIEVSVPAISLADWSLQNGVIFLRLFIFLVTAIRLFIGASVYFCEVHTISGHENRFPRRNYVIDFASAIVHFSIVYWMALGITSALEFANGVSLKTEPFFVAVSFALLYDWVWYVFSLNYTTRPIVYEWAVGNLKTLLPCLVVFVAFASAYIDRLAFEMFFGLAILLFGIPDLIRMAQGKLPTD